MGLSIPSSLLRVVHSDGAFTKFHTSPLVNLVQSALAENYVVVIQESMASAIKVLTIGIDLRLWDLSSTLLA